ncbi:MAG TPA: hypothetical protein VMH36_02365 [Alphaproteobacteria bacterium]|nr:hypothetical protein [Alphaproteobacteria bacterium]
MEKRTMAIAFATFMALGLAACAHRDRTVVVNPPANTAPAPSTTVVTPPPAGTTTVVPAH